MKMIWVMLFCFVVYIKFFILGICLNDGWIIFGINIMVFIFLNVFIMFFWLK